MAILPHYVGTPLERPLPRNTIPVCLPGVNAPPPPAPRAPPCTHLLRSLPPACAGVSLTWLLAAPESGAQLPWLSTATLFFMAHEWRWDWAQPFDNGLLSFHKAEHKLLYEVSPETLPPDLFPREKSAYVTIKNKKKKGAGKFTEALCFLAPDRKLPESTYLGKWAKRPQHIPAVSHGTVTVGRRHHDVDDRHRRAEPKGPDSKGARHVLPLTGGL